MPLTERAGGFQGVLSGPDGFFGESLCDLFSEDGEGVFKELQGLLTYKTYKDFTRFCQSLMYIWLLQRNSRALGWVRV